MSLLERLLPSPGEVVANRYELIEEIGRGGFGVVFRARQIGLDEDVAIKILLPHVLENDQIAMRFEREVAVAKGLRHPNTIRILDYAATEKGLPFYAMELVRGRSLDELLETAGCFSPERTRRIMVQVLKSLAEAHSMGIIHRDLKPANLTITEIYGEEDFVKVLDFGIAKALTSDQHVGQTTTGMVLGTPAYMSPEQALGRKTVDGRSDLYAVGLMVAECLMGRRVVEGETPYVVVAQHASAAPHAFPQALMRSPLWPVVAHATAKNPDDRYPDAAAMRAALEALGWLSDEVDPELRALAALSRSQPSPSLPDFTPAGISSQRQVLGGDHHSATMTVDSSKIDFDRPSPKSNTGRLLLVLLLVGLLGGGVAFLVTRSEAGADGSASREGVASDPGEAARPADRVAAGGTVAGVREEPGESGQSVPTDSAASLSPADLERLMALSTAHALAADRVGAALPEVRPVRLEGEGVTVRHGARTLGITPLELALPRVDAALVLELEREGYRSDTRRLSLLEDRVTIELRRRSERGDRGEREPVARTEEPAEAEEEAAEETETEAQEEETEETTVTSPFGQTRIHD